MDRLYFQLELSSGRIEDYDVEFGGEPAQNIFAAIPIFNQRPLRVSFAERNYDKSFIPSLMFITVSRTISGQIVTKIFQQEYEITTIIDNSETNRLKIFVFDREECLYPGTINSQITFSQSKNVLLTAMNVYLKLMTDAKTVLESKYIDTSLSTWKDTVLTYSMNARGIRLYLDPGSEAVEVYLTKNPKFPDVIPQNNQVFLAETGELINIRSYMAFTVDGYVPASMRAAEGSVKERFDALGGSFSHGLSKVGQRAFDRMKKCIIDRFSKADLFAASIASICQHSGSGKSKIAHEFTKRGPGLSMVMRYPSEDAFPPANNLSTTLDSLVKDKSNVDIKSIDRTYERANEKSKIATILNFLAATLFKNLQELVETACKKPFSDASSYEKAIRESCAECGPRVPVNTAEIRNMVGDYPLTEGSFDQMFKHYKKCSPDLNNLEDLQINHIAEFIDKLLKKPLDYLNQPGNIEYDVFERVCNSLAAIIEEFPFIFVLDEAQIFADYTYDSDPGTNGFQQFRRALTYLLRKTRIFFLTLGTKSVILDMNPPDLESNRKGVVRKYMPPIVLSGNFDILSREQGFRAADFVPTYKTLKNPLVFKLLASLGSPIWSSLLFDLVVPTAITKLKNSTAEKYEDFFVAWMIRTGIMANPKSGSTESLVAKRMADLFNLTTDLSTMSVFYPSQPVFGIAARNICANNSDDKERLFESLSINDNLIDKDRGNLAECIGFMNALLAIDQSPNLSSECTTAAQYEALLAEIKNECPALAPLWELHDYVLQTNNSESLDESRFKNLNNDYHVTTVRDFLLKLYGNSIESQLASFPESTLNGLVNASHVTKLPGLVSFDGLENGSYPLPLPNRLVGDYSRHHIDRSLLQFGLTRQCAFAMPEKYYGIDLIIPVCLDKKDRKGRPLYTFISLQVKADRSTTLKEAQKMQARLHYINCPHADRHATNEPKADCPYCETSDGLDEIFGNQIGLLASLGRSSAVASESNTLDFFATGDDANQQACLVELYGSEGTPMSNSAELNYKKDDSPKSLNDPRANHELLMKNGILFNAILWNDAKVNRMLSESLVIKDIDRRTIGKILKIEHEDQAQAQARAQARIRAREDSAATEPFDSKKAKLEVEVVPERLFQVTDRKQRLFCISSDGFAAFSHLYYAPREAVINAGRVLNPQIKRFGDTSTVDASNMLAAMLYESILPDYNETLMAARGVPMNDEQSQQYFDKLLALAKSQIKAYMDNRNI